MVLDADPTDERDEEDALAMAVRLPWSAIADYSAERRISPERFASSARGDAFRQLVAARSDAPDATWFGLAGQLTPEAAGTVERALGAWDAMTRRRGGIEPTAEDFRVVTLRIVQAGAIRAASLDADQAVDALRQRDAVAAAAAYERATTGLRVVAADDRDPYAAHDPARIAAERASHRGGKGFPINPMFDRHLQDDVLRGDLMVLGGPAKGGKTRLMLQVVLQAVLRDIDANPTSEHQVLIFALEMKWIEFFDLIAELGFPPHLLNTHTGRPRFLVNAMEWFDTAGETSAQRRSSIDREIGFLLAHNVRWAETHQLAVAETHFAFVVVDYVTAVFSPGVGNDYSEAQAFVNNCRRRLCRVDPTYYGVPGPDAPGLSGLPTNVVLIEQLNLRGEVIRAKGEDEPRLRPASMEKLAGSKTMYERATVLLLFNRDPEGAVRPLHEVALSLFGRYVIPLQVYCTFDQGRFRLPYDDTDDEIAPSPRRRRRIRAAEAVYVPKPACERRDSGNVISLAGFIAVRGKWRKP